MTVSRYLRTPEKVKPETARRIASVIEEVGFQPDPDNAAMNSNAIARIGVLVPSFHNQIFADVLAGVETAAAARGYQTLVVNYDYNSQKEEEQIATVLAFNVKALLLTESVHSIRAEKYLRSAKIPVAEVMGLTENSERINVGFDNQRAGLDMTRMLLASGKSELSILVPWLISGMNNAMPVTVRRWRRQVCIPGVLPLARSHPSPSVRA